MTAGSARRFLPAELLFVALTASSAPPEFAAAQQKPTADISKHFEYRGVRADISAIRSLPNLDAVLDALRSQIEIVNELKIDSKKREFLKSVPVAISASGDGGRGNPGAYAPATQNVTLQAQVYEKDRPILLHELMHAYHSQKIPNGSRNTDILKLYQQARVKQLFPARSYMLSNPVEYFGMVASVYLHGCAARDPFTRENLKAKQPDCYRWLEREFGPQ